MIKKAKYVNLIFCFDRAVWQADLCLPNIIMQNFTKMCKTVLSGEQKYAELYKNVNNCNFWHAKLYRIIQNCAKRGSVASETTFMSL